MKNTVEINETNFDSEVLKSTEPVLVDFWAPWCGPCKMLAPVLEQIAAEQNGRVKIAKVNLEENQGLAQTYQVQAVPTLLYFSGGQVRGMTVGLASKKAILAKLESLPAGPATVETTQN
jgi:thioredoxin 1